MSSIKKLDADDELWRILDHYDLSITCEFCPRKIDRLDTYVRYPDGHYAHWHCALQKVRWGDLLDRVGSSRR